MIQARLAGGVYADRNPNSGGDNWQVVPIPSAYHVPGTLKCYSLSCLQAVGGVRERLGWDTIDETYARMRGYRTRAFPTSLPSTTVPGAVPTVPSGAVHGMVSVRTSLTSRSRGLPYVPSRSHEHDLEFSPA